MVKKQSVTPSSDVRNQEPILLVDKRQADWQEAHLRGKGFDVRMVMLPSADFAWSTPWGRVGIEDKPLTALVTDRRSGRLDDELRRLVSQYELPILLIRGYPHINGSGELLWAPQEQEYRKGWTIDSLDNLLLGRQMKGVYVTWCHSDAYLGDRLMAIYKYTQRRPDDAATRPMRSQVMPWLGPLTGRAELIYTLLGQVKGVRDRRELSEKLAATYNWGELIELTPEELMTHGISKLMAHRIKSHIGAILWES